MSKRNDPSRHNIDLVYVEELFNTGCYDTMFREGSCSRQVMRHHNKEAALKDARAIAFVLDVQFEDRTTKAA